VGEVEFTTANTKTQLATKVILMSKLALAITASFLVKNPFWYALTAVSTGYSLWKNHRIKCLNFTRDPHPVNFGRPILNNPLFMPLDNAIRKVVTTYRMLQIPPAASQNDNCGICHEKLPDMAFCAKHLFHQRCLERKVGDATGSMLEDAHFTKYRVTGNGGTSHKYEVDLMKRNMPACFTCQVVPPQNKCQVKVHDRVNGTINAEVTVKN
ncbi:MAG: hypothetical protein LLG04_00265, partial [Parachlamydia sp.]|nr:hypothetical protein [Parachlamydia sp.]